MVFFPTSVFTSFIRCERRPETREGKESDLKNQEYKLGKISKSNLLATEKS